MNKASLNPPGGAPWIVDALISAHRRTSSIGDGFSRSARRTRPSVWPAGCAPRHPRGRRR